MATTKKQKPSSKKVSAKKPRILQQDKAEGWVAVHKPSGWVTTGGEDPESDLSLWLKEKLATPVFPVHRLDRGTCGIVILALSAHHASKMQKLFTGRRVGKRYWAITTGKRLQARGETRLSLKHPKSGEVQAAWTTWIVKAEKQDPETGQWFSFVEVEPKTGRFHQIRLHFSALGSPVAGDDEHGGAQAMSGILQSLERPLLSSIEIAWEGKVLQTQPDTTWEVWKKKLIGN